MPYMLSFLSFFQYYVCHNFCIAQKSVFTLFWLFVLLITSEPSHAYDFLTFWYNLQYSQQIIVPFQLLTFLYLYFLFSFTISYLIPHQHYFPNGKILDLGFSPLGETSISSSLIYLIHLYRPLPFLCSLFLLDVLSPKSTSSYFTPSFCQTRFFCCYFLRKAR